MNQFKQVAENVVKQSVSVTTQVVNSIRKQTTSVFGAAPSLSQMRKINEMNKNKKVIFRGAFFWYHFRVWYPTVFPIIFIVFMIVSLTAWNTIEGHLVMGSILSLIGGISVIASFMMITPWQKHPSVLVLYRTFCDMLFSFVIILEVSSSQPSRCRSYAFVTHSILLASEAWLTTIASDLVHSLTNPFASYKANLKRYHAIVFVFSVFISIVLYFDKSCQGKFDNSVCWVKADSSTDSCLWGYYLFWIACLYAYQMWAFIFAYLRLKRGLSVTFEVRQKTAEETFKCLASYAVYLSMLIFAFVIISSNPTPRPNTDAANFSLFFLFLVANRGTVDSWIWFMLHDFQRDSPESTHSGVSDVENGHPSTPKRGSLVHEGAHLIKHVDLQKTVKSAVTEIAEFAITEFDETDLSPQVNMALRSQIVQYVTRGVRDSIVQEGLITEKKVSGSLDSMMERAMNPRTKDPAVTQGLQVLKFYIEGEHPFKSFAQDAFKEIRAREGITDENYLASLSKPANERLSEGASGAFMFFCGGGEFIVKTIRAREARVLHQSLNAYTTYLRDNDVSFLCRFLGSYSLRIYDQTFYFVVMMNCFNPKAKINERYDIKGSWVGRSAEPPSSKQTKRVVCRHCNSYFIPSQQQKCTAIVGLHEPNIVLKDNDLRTKISLDVNDAVNVVSVLKKDSELLGQLGVIDYSLLAGVKKYKFNVSVADSEVGLMARSEQNHTHFSSTFKAASVSGPAVYYLGIVDFLQDWTFNKRIERLFKIYFGRKDPDGLSVMEPIPYMLRFQSKMEQIFDMEGSKGDSEIKFANNLSVKDNEEIGSQQTLIESNEKKIVRNNYEYKVLQDETISPLVAPMASNTTQLNRFIVKTRTENDESQNAVSLPHSKQSHTEISPEDENKNKEQYNDFDDSE